MKLFYEGSDYTNFTLFASRIMELLSECGTTETKYKRVVCLKFLRILLLEEDEDYITNLIYPRNLSLSYSHFHGVMELYVIQLICFTLWTWEMLFRHIWFDMSK